MNLMTENKRMIPFSPPDISELETKEVADALGISQSYISRLEKRIIEKIKREI